MSQRCAFSAATTLIAAVLMLSGGLEGTAAAQQAQPPAVQPADPPDEPDVDWERLKPKVRLGKVPAIELGPRPVLTQEKKDQIKAYIARLADIDSPDFGLSPTMSGEAFLPLPDQRQSQAMLLTDHQLKSSVALRSLVEIGPDAIPFLLDALSDKTPTKLKLEHRSGFGAMWFADELWGNPASESEMKVIGQSKAPDDAADQEKHIESYTVKVGNVCLVAIGQIVGRGYQAVRYQPTACIVINSPSEDARFREKVRRIWASDDPARKLLNALLLDYAADGVFQGPSLDSWELGSELQIQAAVRLLYYFPKESAALVAERLRTLVAKGTSAHGKGSPATEEELDAYVRREVANRVRTDEFIEAVSWCREPQIREAIRDIFTKTDDIDVLLAALPGIEDADHILIMERFRTFLDPVPRDEGGAFGDGFNLLVELAERLGKDAAPAFESYLRDASEQHCYSAAKALRGAKGDWSLTILSRLLDDTRPIEGYTFAGRQNGRDVRLPIRVCDAAAEALTFQRPELRFTMEGEYKELDEQIKTIREKIAGDR